MKRIILFLVLLFAFLIPASADSDAFAYQIEPGINNIELNTYYNGSYVNSISGTFSQTMLLGTHYIPITVTSETTGTDKIIKLDIEYQNGMDPSFNDLYFAYENSTPIQFTVSNIMENNRATVYLKVDLESQQTILMAYGMLNSSLSNPDGMFNYTAFNRTYNSSYSYNSTNITIYNLNNTLDTDIVISQMYNYGGGAIRIFFNNLSVPAVGANTTSLIYGFSTSNTTAVTSLTKTNPMVVSCSGEKKQVTISNNTAERKYSISTAGLIRLYVTSTASGASGRLVIDEMYVYDRTYLTSVNFGSTTPVTSDPINITIEYPSTDFNNLEYISEYAGTLEFHIDYNPHILMVTQNGSEFTAPNTNLSIGKHPQNIASIEYRIALDPNFYSIVGSGSVNGNYINVSLSIGNYYWQVKQIDGEWIDYRSFNVIDAPEVAGYINIKIFNEINNSSVSATVKLTNSTTTLQKTGNNITFSNSEVIAGNYSVQITATNYTTRFYDVVSPGNYTMYVLPNANASVVYFSIIDNTNTFQFDSTKLEIIKQTPNGSLVVHNSYFDATGFSIATLNNFDNYILKVVSDSGHEKILGNYIQAGQSTVQLVISDFILKENNSSLYGGFTYNLTKSESAIKFDWINPNNALIEPLLFQIYKNDDIVMNISSDASFGSINYQDNVDDEMKLDPNATYRIVLTSKTVNGTIRVNEFYKVGGESVSIDFEKIPIALRIVISLILLILVASLFNITNAKFSAIVVTLVAGFLTLVGFLPILPSVIIWLLFVAIVAYKTTIR